MKFNVCQADRTQTAVYQLCGRSFDRLPSVDAIFFAAAAYGRADTQAGDSNQEHHDASSEIEVVAGVGSAVGGGFGGGGEVDLENDVGGVSVGKRGGENVFSARECFQVTFRLGCPRVSYRHWHPTYPIVKRQI
jgi:hypothetical protein